MAGGQKSPKNCFKVGSKVRITTNLFKGFENFTNKTGVIDGSLTKHGCVVKLKGGHRRWFDLRELELT